MGDRVVVELDRRQRLTPEQLAAIKAFAHNGLTYMSLEVTTGGLYPNLLHTLRERIRFMNEADQQFVLLAPSVVWHLINEIEALWREREGDQREP